LLVGERFGHVKSREYDGVSINPAQKSVCTGFVICYFRTLKLDAEEDVIRYLWRVLGRSRFWGGCGFTSR
jgi:hypothetical protein